ncbi:MAG: copper resistance protein NlpE [Bacteroidales bacterium]|nr:copper resistance protein NlpE [Bacteroidales bacterium]
MKHILIIVAVVVMCASCSILCKKNNFRNTTWTCQVEEFVADAGTMTITTNLTFTSAKDYVYETIMYMPAYPSMYMNADGTVDIHPESTSTWTEKGTYTVKGNTIILTSEEGEQYSLQYLNGKLETSNLSYRPLTLTKAR